MSIITCIAIHNHLNALTGFEFSNITIFDENIYLKKTVDKVKIIKATVGFELNACRYTLSSLWWVTISGIITLNKTWFYCLFCSEVCQVSHTPLILKAIKNVVFQNYEVCPTYDCFWSISLTSKLTDIESMFCLHCICIVLSISCLHPQHREQCNVSPNQVHILTKIVNMPI